jgi:hypothetical protein
LAFRLTWSTARLQSFPSSRSPAYQKGPSPATSLQSGQTPEAGRDQAVRQLRGARMRRSAFRSSGAATRS